MTIIKTFASTATIIEPIFTSSVIKKWFYIIRNFWLIVSWTCVIYAALGWIKLKIKISQFPTLKDALKIALLVISL
jgi:hypothetical protein